MSGSNKVGQLWTQQVASSFNSEAEAVIAPGDCLKSLLALLDLWQTALS